MFEKTETKQKFFLMLLIAAYSVSFVGKILLSQSPLLLLTHYSFQAMIIAMFFAIAEFITRQLAILRPKWWDGAWGLISVLMIVLSLSFFIILPKAWEYFTLTKIGIINFVFHIISPMLTLVYLFFILPHTHFKWKNALLWLVYPTLYMVFSVFFFNSLSLGLITAAKLGTAILLTFLTISLTILFLNNTVKPLIIK